MRRVSIGLLGCGTVGRGFVDLLARERERIRGRDGIDIAVRRILVRDADKPRPGINPSAIPTFRRTSGSTEACVIVGG